MFCCFKNILPTYIYTELVLYKKNIGIKGSLAHV